jgi:hypothetical protein
LTFDAYIPPNVNGRGCYVGYAVAPAWLDPCAVSFLQGSETDFDAEVPELAAHLDPALGQCEFGGRSPAAGCPFVAFVGGWLSVDGHVADPAAETCAAEPFEDVPIALDPAQVVNECRLAFVVTAIRPPG